MIRAGIVVTDPEFRKTIVECLEGLGVKVEFDIEDTAGQTHLMEYTSPDLLVLDFSRPGMPAVMAEIKSMELPVSVVAVHQLGEPDAILTALRMGAREFLWPPLNERALRETVWAIEFEKAQREARSRESKTVGFLAATGGCGATTLACHVAAELQRSEAGEVGLLDFDVAAGMAGFWFGSNGSHSVLDAVHQLGRMDSSLWKGLAATVRPRLDVLGAPAEIPLGGLPGMRGFLEVLRFARGQYDWVVADLAAHLTPLSAALIEELDTLFLVTTPELSCVVQARRVSQKILELGCPKTKLKVVVSRAEREHAVSPEEIKKLLGLPLEAVFPGESAEILEAHASGRLISPRSEYGKRIVQLTAKLSGRTVEGARPSRFSWLRFGAQEA